VDNKFGGVHMAEIKVVFLSEGFVGFLVGEGIFLLTLDVVVPLVKLSAIVPAGQGMDGQDLQCKLEGKELIVFSNGEPFYTFKLSDEALRRLEVLADLIDDARFVSYLSALKKDQSKDQGETRE